MTIIIPEWMLTLALALFSINCLLNFVVFYYKNIKPKSEA